MPRFSAFTPFGQLEFSSKPSVLENVYRAMVNGLGGQYDLTVGGHNEATVYARARGVARAKQALRRAGNQAFPLKTLELLPLQERGYGLVPNETDTIAQRQQALAARMLLARGATRENVETQLRAVLGTAFLGYRTLAAGEVTTWPADPSPGPGIFPRLDGAVVAKYIRLIEPVAATGQIVADSYSEANQDADAALQDTVGADLSGLGQSFIGNGGAVLKVRWYLKKTGSPTGTAVARIYAHSGAFGYSGLPTGTALATSDPFTVSALTGSHALTDFVFSGANQITLTQGTPYVVTLEYSSGSGGNIIQAGIDFSSSTHAGNLSTFGSAAWSVFAGADACFYVMTSLRVGYTAIDPTQGTTSLAAGDVMTVQLENVGLAERITVVSVGADAAGQFFTATFANAHDIGSSGIVGSVPVWMSTQRVAFIECTVAASIDSETVRKVTDVMTRVARGVSQWSIVQPTTPGATTMGPFKLGLSPLGAVPTGTLNL